MHSGESAQDDVSPVPETWPWRLNTCEQSDESKQANCDRYRGRIRHRNGHLLRVPRDEPSVTYKSKICVVVDVPCSSRILKNGSPASGLQRKCNSTSCGLDLSSFSIISEAWVSKPQEGQPSREDACTASYDISAVQDSWPKGES